MLRYAPAVVRREVVNDARDDPCRFVAQRRVPQHIGRRQQRLDGVHVRVDAAVPVDRAERLVPLFDDHAVRVVPELAEHHRQGVVEQGASADEARGGCAGRGDDDERVLVCRLVRGGGPSGGDRGVPATVLVIVEGPRESLHSVVGETAGPGTAHQPRQSVDVRHPAGDPQLGRPVEVGLAAFIEPGEASCRVPRSAPELEQPVSLGLQPTLMYRACQPH